MRKSIFRPWNGIPMATVFWEFGRYPDDTDIGNLQRLYEKRYSIKKLRRDARRKRYLIS